MANAAARTASAPAPGVAYAAVAAVLVFWSGTAVANRFAVAYIDALTAGAFRSMIAGCIALMLALLLRLPFPVTRRQRVILVYAGWMNFAIWPSMLSLGIWLANASHAALIMALIPVFTGLIAAMTERRQLRAGWWVGAAIAVTGTAFLIAFSRPADDLQIAARFLWGDLILLAGVGLCASGYVAGARLSPSIGSWGSTFWGLAAALILLVPAVIMLWPRTDWAAVPADGWAALAWLALLSSMAGYALWFFAMERAGIARVAVWQFTQPLLTIVAAGLLLDEPLTWQIALAAAGIIGGTVLAYRYAQ